MPRRSSGGATPTLNSKARSLIHEHERDYELTGINMTVQNILSHAALKCLNSEHPSFSQTRKRASRSCQTYTRSHQQSQVSFWLARCSLNCNTRSSFPRIPGHSGVKGNETVNELVTRALQELELETWSIPSRSDSFPDENLYYPASAKKLVKTARKNKQMLPVAIL